MIRLNERPPFDGPDAAVVARYLESARLTAYDPFTDPNAGDDPVFTASLAGARFMMEQSFATKRPDGSAFRGYPVIVDRSSVNAFAKEVQGLQICGLDIGLGVAAYELSLFVFSQASLFQEIGNAAAEASPVLPERAQLSFWMADQLRTGGRDDGQPAGIELVPRDPQRQRAAQYLTQLLLRFVWLHEQFHCLNGHTGLLATQGQSMALHEVPIDAAVSLVKLETSPEAQARQVLLHCMEFDADRTACWTLVRMQQADFEPLDDLAALPQPTRLKLVVFAAFLMTFLFDQAARRQGRAFDEAHPLAYHRLHNLVRTLASNPAGDDDQIRKAFVAVLEEMRALGACVPQILSVEQLIQDLRSSELQGLFNKIEEILTNARTSFVPFAYSFLSLP